MNSRKHWDFSGNIKAAWFCVLALLTILLPVKATGAGNPHAFMDDPSRCLQCHDSLTFTPDGPFTRDIDSLCGECHSLAHRLSHPLDIRPQAPVPDDLPLDGEGTITCATCHDPHSDPSAGTPYVNRGLMDRIKAMFTSGGYPTYFLRMPNTRGELCFSCHRDREGASDGMRGAAGSQRDYTGSKACERCHETIYREWKKTAHARTTADPRENPDAIAAVFYGNEGFQPKDVEMVIGLRWIQRYAIRRGGELVIAPGVWSMSDSTWERSSAPERSWKDHCAGCHLTGYDPYEDSYVEKSVGCEMCHGPGGPHVRSGRGGNIVNPASIGRQLARSICASCHTAGHDRTGRYRYPAGYLPGRELDLYYRGLLPHRGQGEDTFKGDGTLEDRLRSLEYWLTQTFRPSRAIFRQCGGLPTYPDPPRSFEKKELTLAQYCFTCHGELGEDKEHRLRLTNNADCASCHAPAKDSDGKPSIHDHKYVAGQ